MTHQALLFDFDDCLFETASDRTWTTLLTLHKNGYRDATWEEAWSHLGQPTVERMLATAGIEDREEGVRLAEIWEETNLRVGYPTARPYPDVAKTLKVLTNLPMGIFSASLCPVIENVLERHALSKYFRAIVGKEDSTEPKPSPRGLLALCERMGVEPGTCLYVGDSPGDIEAGNAAGMTTVAVTHGCGTVKSLNEKKPDHLIDWFPELVAIAWRGG